MMVLVDNPCHQWDAELCVEVLCRLDERVELAGLLIVSFPGVACPETARMKRFLTQVVVEG